MGTLTPVSQSTGRLDDIACYAKGALVSGGVSLLTSACLISNNAIPEIVAVASAVFMAHIGGQYALQQKSQGLEGRAPILDAVLATAFTQSYVEVLDAACTNRFPGWIAAGIVGSFIAAPFCVVASSIMTAMAVAPVYSKLQQTILDMIELEKGVSKAIEAVEGAKSYPTRNVLISADLLAQEWCAVVPQGSESLQNELLALGFERLENGSNGVFFYKNSPMHCQVALFENEADLTSYMEPAPVETVSPIEAEPIVEQIQVEVVTPTEEEPAKF